MRRWFRGGWQNLIKHLSIPEKPGMALEISLMYIEGLVYSLVLFILPIINLYISLYFLAIYCLIIFFLGFFAALKEKRIDLILALGGYLVIKYINAYIFLEQFFYEVILRKKDLHWFKPKRVNII